MFNFGLHNAAQTFQLFMDQVVQGLNFVVVHVDDILVASHSPLKPLFTRLQDYYLRVHPYKRILGAREVHFLGHRCLLRA